MQRVLRRLFPSVVTSIFAAFAIAPLLAAQSTGVIEGRVVAAVTD
jgi:hypothetical protein